MRVLQKLHRRTLSDGAEVAAKPREDGSNATEVLHHGENRLNAAVNPRSAA
jgi:hypothetical protein